MTLHKIDREKLAEELKSITINDMGDYTRVNIKKPHICTLDPVQILQAAQNWLTITDPMFEVSEAMVDAADNIEGWEGRYINKMFKAMIAKAGE